MAGVGVGRELRVRDQAATQSGTAAGVGEESRSVSWLTVHGGEVGELETGGTDKRVVQERGGTIS